MRRNRLTFLFLLVALVIVAYFAWDIYSGGETAGTLSGEPLTDYAVEDTAAIDKIEIWDATLGLTATLERENEHDWTVNGTYCARPDAVQLILKTLKRVQVQQRVPKNAVENIIKSLATRKKVVRIYKDGEMTKKWIVGNPTRDHYGTYMNLEKKVGDEWLISKEPMVMELPGFNGHLWSRFFAEENEWRCSEIWQYDPKNIESVEMTFPGEPEQSYKLTLDGGNTFTLYDGNGNNVGVFDTTQARTLFVGLKRVNFEQFEKVHTEEQLDSIKQVQPYFKMTVTDGEGNATPLTAWKIKVENQFSPEGHPLDWDPDRMFAQIESGEIVTIQFFVFDPLIRRLSYFTGRK